MSGLFGGGKRTSTAAEQLSNMSIQTSGYGRCIPVVYGKARVAANLIYYDNFRAIPHLTKQKTGKGGGSIQYNTTYTYTARVILGLCEGPVTIAQVWIDKENYASLNAMPQRLTFYPGDITQAPWPVLPSNKAVGYGATAYAAHSALDLGESATTKNHSFEVIGFCAGSTGPAGSGGGDTGGGGNPGLPPGGGGGGGGEIIGPPGPETPVLDVAPGGGGNDVSTNAIGPEHPTLDDPPGSGGGGGNTGGGGSSNTGGNEGGAGGSGNAGAAAGNGGNGGDANPADVIFDMLTHPIHGMNFPPGAIDSAALADYRAYASAASLLVSAAYEEQKQGIEVIKTLLECTNAMPVWSDGKLRIVPLGDQDIKDGDGNILWQANSTPLYALNSDDFLGSDDPVRVKRNTSADAYNSVKIKFSDRALEYAENIVEASDLAMQDLYGIRDASEFNADCIANIDAAQKLAQIQLQKYVGIRNEYEFNLGWRYTRLEPGDLVTLTEQGLGLNNTPVRITSIEEDMDGELTVTAVDWPNGIATAVAYPPPPRDDAGGGYNMAVDPGDCNAPVIFEPPGDLTGGQLQVWIGTSGGQYWGGCEIHASRDNISYSLIGKITAPARHGILTTAITASSNTIGVDLTVSGGTLLSVLAADASQLQTLSYLDGELISYQTAANTGTTLNPNRYNLTTIKRGLFSTQAASHAVNSKFMRLDDAAAVIDLSRWNKGETIYLKFLSFNSFGQSLQDPALVNPITYKILGTGLTTWKAPTACTIAITDTMPS